MVFTDGWYLDRVELSDQSIGSSSSQLGVMPSAEESASRAKETDQKRERAKQKEKVDPSSIAPENGETKSPARLDKAEAVIDPASLPLQATVSVLESGRSVVSNPTDGSYQMPHPAGEYTVRAEAYGYSSEEQTIEVAVDEVATANFVLEELPQGDVSGIIKNEVTGEAISDATVFLVEDANVTPVKSDEEGHFSLTAYEGTYTLRVSAYGYFSQEAEVVIDGDVD